MINVQDELDRLSPKEKEEALKILQEYAATGKSATMDKLLYEDYVEVPVDIHTFLHEEQYLGAALYDKEGRFTLYPFWEETLKQIYPTNIDTDYHTAILTGGIGIGKSTVAVIGMIYALYRMLCLKDPQIHYGLQNNELISFVFVNMTLREAKGVGWAKFHNYVLQSSWFMNHGTISKSTLLPTWKPNNQSIELYAASTPGMLQGRAIFGIFVDEVNFSTTTIDIVKQKARAKRLVTEAANRLQSRFMKGTKNPTTLWLASSKASDQSYLDEFINQKKQIDSKTTLIVDQPQWVVRPDKDSPIKFQVAVGNKFMENVLLPKNSSQEYIKQFIDKGYTILNVPIGYYENFNSDLDGSLRDIAGISVGSNSSFIYGARLTQCIRDDLRNPFTKEIIEVGDDPNDGQQYYNFFDMSYVPKDKIAKPLYIHIDPSLSGDKTGIAGVWIVGKKPNENGESGRDLQFQLAFSVSVKAPRGRQVSFEKTRNFIRWLRQMGFNIKTISADTFQSASTLQQLQAEGFNTQVISVDRVKDRQCIPYEYFRNTLYEQRIYLYKTQLLREELVNLQKDNNTGKVDHPHNGSKDQADAVAASTYSASLHGEEYAFDYGESIDTMLEASADKDDKDMFTQLPTDYYLKEVDKTEKSIFMDFGNGLPQAPDMTVMYANQGILII